MKDDKLKWYIINKDYVNYLKKFDGKVQNVDYNNKMQKIKRNANKLYNEKINNPNSKISKRCCNFKLLEEKAELYHNQNT